MNKPSNRLRNSRDLFAIVLAITVGVLTWFSREIFDFLTPPQTNLSTPSLVGLNEIDAKNVAARLHLEGVTVARRANDRFPAGVIASQDPLPDTEVRPGRRISLVVSDGQHTISMPDLRFRSQREVGLILSRLHLNVTKTKQVDSDIVDRGHVVDQKPLPLTQVKDGDSVEVSYSRGQNTTVTVNDFVGLQVDDARDDAKSAKIRFGQIVWTPFGAGGPPRGVVVRQRPAPGTTIDAKQYVSLQVSAGPHQFGYLVREVHAAITIPLEAPSAQMRVVAVDTMGSRPVYEGYGSSGQRIDVTATTVGPADLYTYLNNELIDTTNIAHEAPGLTENSAEKGTKSKVTPKDLGITPAPKSTKEPK